MRPLLVIQYRMLGFCKEEPRWQQESIELYEVEYPGHGEFVDEEPPAESKEVGYALLHALA